MTIWYTSDHHFGHENIIRLAKRPFSSLDEMHQVMVNRWNAVVKPDDIVWHLGDFTYKDKANAGYHILSKLNGKKQLIIGNHESNQILLHRSWETVNQYAEIQDGKTSVILFHYPIRSWNRMGRGSVHLYGHTHGNSAPFGKSYDVGVDVWNFSPVTLDEIITISEYKRSQQLAILGEGHSDVA